MFYNNLSKTCTCHVTDCKHVMYVIPSGIPPDRDEMEYIQPNILIFIIPAGFLIIFIWKDLNLTHIFS